ncbi:beta-microseminoprotein J1-like [Megalobrama amblycephala]|uniref:beta-microseminoprotein J1-like n=1 Tax=Megalobrama amblycephala TaxID=75352 RepID=UPI0020147405|nr:beta-microseminoprotein J1-like [Megalobrama amblycephala]
MTAFHRTIIWAKRTKMTSLALVLVFCAFVSLSDSACFHELLKPGAKYCTDGYDKSRHPIGSTWTNDRCTRCTCSSSMMDCCDTMGRAIIKTEGCIVNYDYSTCTFKVFHPEDPTFRCSYGAVGK